VPAGGAAGIRTPDLRRARAALSRLSYGPLLPLTRSLITRPSGVPPAGPVNEVGAPGLEPGTSALSGPRSNHLSYAPSASSVCSTRSPHARTDGAALKRKQRQILLGTSWTTRVRTCGPVVTMPCIAGTRRSPPCPARLPGPQHSGWSCNHRGNGAPRRWCQPRSALSFALDLRSGGLLSPAPQTIAWRWAPLVRCGATPHSLERR
jgi:hypothetical protein